MKFTIYIHQGTSSYFWPGWWWKAHTIYLGKWALADAKMFTQFRRFIPSPGADVSAGWEV